MATPIVPSIGAVAAKWRRKVEAAPQDYEEGIRTKGAKWQPAARAASASFKAAITAPDIDARYARGIDRSGQKYMTRAVAVGPSRFAQSAPVAEPEYSQRMAPVLQMIAGVDLPPRGPRGSMANYGRVQPIGAALNKMRLAGGK